MQSYSFLLFRFTGIQTSSHNSFALLFPCCTLPASFLWLPWLLALHLGEDCSYPFILSHPYPCSDSSSQSRLFSHLVEECSGNSQLTLSHSLASAGELSISSEGSGQPFWLNPLQRVPYRPIFWNLFLVFSALQSHFFSVSSSEWTNYLWLVCCVPRLPWHASSAPMCFSSPPHPDHVIPFAPWVVSEHRPAISL